MNGKAKAEKALPPDHQLGMKVPRGGSMCANCKFLASPTTCGNKGFVTWNGSPKLPHAAEEYCCDLFEIGEQKRAEGGRVGYAEGGAPALSFDDLPSAAAGKAEGINIRPAGGLSFDDLPGAPEMSQPEKAAKGLGRGLAGFVGDLGEAAMGPFGPSHHAGNLMADLGLGERPKQEAPYGAQIAHATGIEDPKPGYTGTISEFLGNPASYFGPGGPLRKLLMATASGAGSEAAGQATEGTGWEGPARTAGALIAGPLAARALKPELAPAQQALADQGVTQMTPGQLAGGFFKGMEDKLTSVPILGDFINSGRRRSIASFNRATANQALDPIGETLERRTVAGHDTITEVHDKLSDAYDNVVPHLTLTPDPQWFSDLRDIYNRNVHILPTDHQQQYQRIINQEFGRPGAPLSGEQVKVIEGNLNRLARKYGSSTDANQQLLGEALGNTVDAIRTNLERQNPAVADELQRVNVGYAMYDRMRVAAANRRGSEGVFSPGDLLTAVKRGDQSVKHGSFAMGRALMQHFAEAGQRVLPSTVPDSGTPGRLMASLATGSGAAYLYPKVLAGVAAASAPYLRPSMALLNRYVRPTAASPGLAGLRAEMSDMGRGAGMLRPFMQTRPGPYPSSSE